MIWNDSDVACIYEVQDGEPKLLLDMLGPIDQMLMLAFIDADRKVDDYTTAEAAVCALVEGVHAFESISDSAKCVEGWKKFIGYITGCNVQILWDKFRLSEECAIFGDWITDTFSKNGWKPDGGVSALGSVFSNCMSVAAQAGGGVRLNAKTGRFEAPTGERARNYPRPPGCGG